jgi:hypothetical protein
LGIQPPEQIITKQVILKKSRHPYKYKDLFYMPRGYRFIWAIVSIFEVGIWTSVQHKNVNDFLSFLFKRARFKRGEFKFILIEEDCDMICREGYVGVGNPHVHLKHINNIWEILKGAYYARNIMIVVNSK